MLMAPFSYVLSLREKKEIHVKIETLWEEQRDSILSSTAVCCCKPRFVLAAFLAKLGLLYALIIAHTDGPATAVASLASDKLTAGEFFVTIPLDDDRFIYAQAQVEGVAEVFYVQVTPPQIGALKE